MAKRSQRQQTKHDEGVQSSAEYYESQGFDVQADIQGYPKPKAIDGRRPDLIATKGHETVIVEHETLESLPKDKDQRKTFKDYAETHEGVRFRTRVVK
jgi:hypothetical protein